MFFSFFPSNPSFQKKNQALVHCTHQLSRSSLVARGLHVKLKTSFHPSIRWRFGLKRQFRVQSPIFVNNLITDTKKVRNIGTVPRSQRRRRQQPTQQAHHTCHKHFQMCSSSVILEVLKSRIAVPFWHGHEFRASRYHHGYQETAPQESPSHDPTPGQPAAQDEQAAEFFRTWWVPLCSGFSSGTCSSARSAAPWGVLRQLVWR